MSDKNTPAPTPRTDAAKHSHWQGGYWSPGFEAFARELERELATEKARVKRMKALVIRIQNVADDERSVLGLAMDAEKEATP
jgi:hypothetical protein